VPSVLQAEAADSHQQGEEAQLHRDAPDERTVSIPCPFVPVENKMPGRRPYQGDAHGLDQTKRSLHDGELL
jgi:hypothetical protein